MNVGSFITLGIVLITAYGTLRVYLYQSHHSKSSIGKLFKKIDEINRRLDKQGERIARIEGRLNNN